MQDDHDNENFKELKLENAERVDSIRLYNSYRKSSYNQSKTKLKKMFIIQKSLLENLNQILNSTNITKEDKKLKTQQQQVQEQDKDNFIESLKEQ